VSSSRLMGNEIYGSHYLFTCSDVDECSTTSGICSNGRCENFMGGYECICDPGYKPTSQKTSCQGFFNDTYNCMSIGLNVTKLCHLLNRS
jgi:hypothetical protein